MADVSKVTASDGTTYDIKDATARSGLSDKMDKANPTGTGALSINRKSGSTTGANSTALGTNCIASGSSSFAVGYQTQATGSYSHSEGYNAKATGGKAHAEGTSTVASGTQSHAEGGNTYAYGSNSHAEGYYTYAGSSSSSNHYSHAEGTYTSATGEASHAEGKGTSSNKVTASGEASHAEGGCTTASGQGSHAEGEDTVASGLDSHAEGFTTTASGQESHAEGAYTVASGQRSHAEGDHTKAAGNQQHVSGMYNIEDSNSTYAEIIGNGTADDARSNARTLDWSGNEVISGGFQCNAMNVSSSSVTLVNPQKWRDAIFDCTPDSSAKDRLLSRLTKSGTNIQVLEYGGYFGGSAKKRLKITFPSVGYGKYLIYIHMESNLTVLDYEIFCSQNQAGTAMERAAYGKTTPTWTSMAGTAATGDLTWTANGLQIYSSQFDSYGGWYVKIIANDGPSSEIPNVYYTNES